MVRKYFIILSLLSIVLNGVLVEPAFVTLKSRLIDWGYQQKVKGEVEKVAGVSETSEKTELERVSSLPESRSISELLKINMPKVDGIN